MKILGEKNFAMSDLAETSKAKQASKALAADAFIHGRVSIAGSKVTGWVRLVDIEGQLLGSTTFDFPSSPEAVQLFRYVQRPAGDVQNKKVLPPLALYYDVLGQHERTGGAIVERNIRDSDGSTLDNGDQYRVKVRASSDCYFYLITYDSLGDVYVLFPHEKIKRKNPLRGGMTYTIPGDDDPWFTLDDNPGKETLIFIASYDPITDLDALIRRMQQAGKVSSDTNRAVKKTIAALQKSVPLTTKTRGDYAVSSTRGTFLSRPKATYTLKSGRKIESVMSVIEGKSLIVKYLSFEHVSR